MHGLRSLVPLAIFAIAYAAIAMLVKNSYYQLMLTLVLVWAVFGLDLALVIGVGLVAGPWPDTPAFVPGLFACCCATQITSPMSAGIHSARVMTL